jgi:predicted Fe-Mo cluster-binding NifX family protein
MKICIPTIDAKEQSSEMCESFGSAPYFTIYDCDTGAYGTLSISGHEHRICNPMKNFKDKGIDCVVCKDLGRRALDKLRRNGIREFRI